MNKGIVILSTAVMLTAGGFAFACGGDCDKGEMKEMMEHGKEHGMMMERTVVATSDGGVVVVSGNHIVKYDRGLKLVNQADLPKPAGKMDHDCPMMKKMMEKKENKGNIQTKPEAADKAHH